MTNIAWAQMALIDWIQLALIVAIFVLAGKGLWQR